LFWPTLSGCSEYQITICKGPEPPKGSYRSNILADTDSIVTGKPRPVKGHTCSEASAPPAFHAAKLEALILEQEIVEVFGFRISAKEAYEKLARRYGVALLSPAQVTAFSGERG